LGFEWTLIELNC